MEKEYLKRINQALKYIEQHLTDDLSLETVSQVAHYSPFYFHRLFKAVVGETLNTYITRKRIEKAAIHLMHKGEGGIAQLADECGFNSNAAFTRAFFNYYGVNPSEFKKQNPGKYSKIDQVESKNGEKSPLFEQYVCNIQNHLNWIKMNATIEVKELPKKDVAAVTHFGVEGVEQAFEKIIRWSNAKGIMDSNTKLVRIFHDSFKVTAPDKVKMNIGVVLNDPISKEGEVFEDVIPSGRTIKARYEINPMEFEQAWSSLFIWMNEKGYQKAEKHPYEIYHNDFREHPEQKCIVDFCIPVM